MTISTDVIEQAIETLEREGIFFEDNSTIGECLQRGEQRGELWNIITAYFEELGKNVDCQSLSIPAEGNYYYYIFVWEIFESKYPDNMFYKDAIKIEASKHYKVKTDEISFDFL